MKRAFYMILVMAISFFACELKDNGLNTNDKNNLANTFNQSDNRIQYVDNRICGVTIDRITRLTELIAALKKLPVQRPVVRIVFDEWVDASEYLSAVKKLSQVADIMGELLDSEYFNEYSPEEYKARANDYLKVLGNYVAVWEVGNEINGEWLGPDVIKKVNSAYSIFKNAGKKVCVNFYYNQECAEPGYEMFEWINANVPSNLRQGLDWVLFSYYEDDCENVIYNASHWEGVFAQLGNIFPNAKLGFGEVGTAKKSKKKICAQRYYSLKINHPRFIGGFFWWYFWQDRLTSLPQWISEVW